MDNEALPPEHRGVELAPGVRLLSDPDALKTELGEDASKSYTIQVFDPDEPSDRVAIVLIHALPEDWEEFRKQALADFARIRQMAETLREIEVLPETDTDPEY